MLAHTYKSQFTTNFELCKAKLPATHKISVIYLHGLYSNPYGRKPEEVKLFCEENNLDFCRFELIGHGIDEENYLKADVNLWKAQILEIIDDLIEGDVLLYGHSIGGWLAFLAALERPKRVKSVLTTAAALDSTEDLIKYLPLPQKEELEKTGKIEFPTKDFTYVFSKNYIDSGRDNLLLDKPINISCPLHLLQGQQDKSVDWKKVLTIADLLVSKDVTIKILKDSNHRMQDDIAIQEILNSLKSLINI